MENNDKKAWLLRAIAATQAEEIYCDDVQEHLDRYVDDLLRDRPDDQPIYAQIRQHLLVCPDCKEEYDFIYENLAELIADGLPDYQKLEQEAKKPSTSKVVDPSIMNKVLPNIHSDVFDQKVLATLNANLQQLNTFATKRGNFRSSSVDKSSKRYEIQPIQTDSTLIPEIDIIQSGATYTLEGSLKNYQRSWINQPIRLYRISSHPLSFTLHQEALVQVYGVFEFEDLAVDQYILAFEPNEESLYLFFINIIESE